MSKENLSCHRDESKLAIPMQNIIFVEVNNVNISVKDSFIILKASKMISFFILFIYLFFFIFLFSVTCSIAIKFICLNKIHMFGRGLLRNISLKLLLKYLQ